jgi:predicted nucleotide-binding protein (sugar kinase/HSP70/actin superfamily)
MPAFGYGCAVFLQADIVDFQRQGWQPEEIMAGLAAVLPKNVWLYVAQMPNLPSLGRTFVLQGGTQHNMAAVKAQVDFIESRFRGRRDGPVIRVHEHCGEAGAIGAALEAHRLWTEGRRTSFIGMPAVRELRYQTHRSEQTRCGFCKNHCLRTFVDISVGPEPDPITGPSADLSAVPEGTRRIVVGNSCERGGVQDVRAMREIKRTIEANKDAYPNFADLAGTAVWRPRHPERVPEPAARRPVTRRQRDERSLRERRGELRIGIPRVLNMYSVNPFFSAYFESLGVPARNLVYSDFTSERLFREGIRRASVDPCFPSKLGIPHVHDLLTRQHERHHLDVVLFPMIDALPAALQGTQASRSCATVTATPEAVKAAFLKEADLFAEAGVRYLDPIVDMADRQMCERQMYLAFRDLLGLTPDENRAAVAVAFRELEAFWSDLAHRARAVIDQLEAEDRLGIVLLGRPYHDDPGINHGILADLQRAGYPVLTCETLPTDPEFLDRLFGEEIARGVLAGPFDISDVWKHSYSENTSRKLWAAKVAARHPNLVAVELSSFKCGHDAPVYATVQRIIQDSGTPYFCFKDIDENRPASSFRLRIETISYSLERYRQDELLPLRRRQRQLEERLAEVELRLRAELGLAGVG